MGKQKEYLNFLKEIKERITSAQYEALRAVNKELINLYWDIGKRIVEKQKQLGWRKSVIEMLALDLQKEFPGISGFSERNLWSMRQFYFEYHNKPKLRPLVAEISWTKNLRVMEKCKSDEEKEFYLKQTKTNNWTKNVLVHQIENQTYEKYLLNQTNFDKTITTKIKAQSKFVVKDEYTFDFLELKEEHLEKELEKGLVGNIKNLLSELGNNFCFVASQYRIEISGDEFFIDLLLYHRTLRCLIAIDLKIGNFKPEYVGKMQFYLSALDDLARINGENKSIGIIICKDKNRTIVEYTLRDTNKPIGVSTYKIPEKIIKLLPTKEELKKIIKGD
ncbi:MAG TPA: PDDEXK nuclease domain-containing protein [archaeon]|nr:PDDEXK nuclease domain-containing protein [archaeon]